MSERKLHTEEELAEIEVKIKAAWGEIKRLKAIRLNMIAEHWGCVPGAEVISSGERYLVRSIDDSCGELLSQPWVNVSKRRKDGSWSDATRTIYRAWELAPDATPPTTPPTGGRETEGVS